MTLLNSAIRAELEANYRKAVARYRKLAAKGSPLDRVGIYQALARCNEKLAVFKKAGYWHERAGTAYLRLPSSAMSPQEKAYYALVEFRGAVQDYRSGEAMRRAGETYLNALNTCLRAGKEGYSHEMLFAGHLSKKIGQIRKAASFFADSAVLFRHEGKLKLAQEMNGLAAECLEEARRGSKKLDQRTKTIR